MTCFANTLTFIIAHFSLLQKGANPKAMSGIKGLRYKTVFCTLRSRKSPGRGVGGRVRKAEDAECGSWYSGVFSVKNTCARRGHEG